MTQRAITIRLAEPRDAQAIATMSRDFIEAGPLSGYLHLQFFNGFGESILDYNVRRKAQFRVGLAIVP